MAITALTDLTKLPNRSTDQQTFDNAVAALISNLPLRAQQENELAANLNSIAAGGGFAIPYMFNPDDLTKVDGRISVTDPSSQATTTNLFVNRIATNGINYSPVLSEFAASTSVIKGYARVVKQADPSKFLVFAILAVGVYDRYFQFSGVVIQGSQSNPFSYTDSVLLTFTRTGDKGDLNSFPRMLVRDQGASGASPQNLAAGWNTRRLATVVYNDIPNASLSSSILTLPVGRYSFEGSAAASGTNGHVIALRNTSGGVFDIGENEYAPSNTAITTRAFISSIFAISSQTQIRLDHYATLAGAGGIAISNGVAEVYSHLQIIKIA